MGLQKTLIDLRPELYEVSGYYVAKLNHSRSIRQLKETKVDAIVIDNEALFKKLLMDDVLYLKPTFFIGNTNHMCDGMVTDPMDSRIKRKLDILLPSILAFDNLQLPDEGKQRLLTKLTRYLISRKKTLQPVNTRSSKIGYSYPLIQDMSIENDLLFIQKGLHEYTQQNYFRTKYIDKINTCYECQGSYLNFGECCTKCNSLDLDTEQLIHHFRCAYVGPQSDFDRDQRLVCPKCDHTLKHIGIDYDKPSEITTCKSCSHSSQETKMKAKCVDCGKENELEQLTTHEILEYIPTEKANSYAKAEHKDESFIVAEKSDGSSFTNPGIYKLIKSHEIARPTQNQFSTFEFVLTINNKLMEGLCDDSKNALLEELGSIIRPYLKPNDLLSKSETQELMILLVDYANSGAEELLDILKYNLNKMLGDNGWAEGEAVTIVLNILRR